MEWLREPDNDMEDDREIIADAEGLCRVIDREDVDVAEFELDSTDVDVDDAERLFEFDRSLESL